MAYVTICDECLAEDHDHCGESKLNPELERIEQWNQEHSPEDMLIGGGICVCGHGEPESAFQQSVREGRLAER